MKKILVPTDFSKNAENALNYAIEIANEFGSTIHILNTYLAAASTGAFISIERYLKADAEAAMEKLQKKVTPKLKNGATIQCETMHGDSDALISKVAKSFDLVIMGTQGETGLSNIFIGSTAATTIRDSTTPVLVIPHGTNYTRPEKIVFAVDNLAIEKTSSISILKEMVQQFKSQLFLFHFDKDKKGEGINEELNTFLEDTDVNFCYQVGGDSLNKSINDFAENQNADLLCMLRRKRGFWESLFHKSATKREVFSSVLPILILEEK